MREKTFAFDLGTGSIGWAVVDHDQVQHAGVRIFPEGVEDLGKGEKEQALNATRREKRQKRRQFYRKRLRKRDLLRILARLKMIPMYESELEKKGYREVLSEQEVKAWLAQNPYDLRRRALEEPITRFELGRIFYHFAQRRGFQSNSRQAQTEDDTTIFKGVPKKGKVGINETKQQIEEAQSTLGAVLQGMYPPEGQTYLGPLPRIRNRYTTRAMYIEEFDKIWARQAPALGLDQQKFSVKRVHLLRGSIESKRNQRRIERLKASGKKVSPPNACFYCGRKCKGL